MALIMGLNSGTAFDGIDVVLAETTMGEDNQPTLPKFINGISVEWPERVKDLIMKAFNNEVDMIGLTRLNYATGAVFADAANQFLKEFSISPSEIEVLGCDLQAVFNKQPDHRRIKSQTEEEKKDLVSRWLDDGPYACGMWLGESSIIAAYTNITTVSYFRPADHAWGGNGAPLMQYYDWLAFRDLDHTTLTLNIGGIANVQLVYKDRGKMVAFDTGPGNVMMDHASRSLYNIRYDKDGEIAASGTVNPDMLAELMRHPYFDRPLPRSGWRNDFSSVYGDTMLSKYSHLKNEDVMVTLCAFTAESIVRNTKDNIPDLSNLTTMIASGGGVRNPTLMKFIQERLPIHMNLVTSDEYGIPAQFKEALKFSALAYATVHQSANNIPAASHASQYTILGKISPAPRLAKGIY